MYYCSGICTVRIMFMIYIALFLMAGVVLLSVVD